MELRAGLVNSGWNEVRDVEGNGGIAHAPQNVENTEKGASLQCPHAALSYAEFSIYEFCMGFLAH